MNTINLLSFFFSYLNYLFYTYYLSKKKKSGENLADLQTKTFTERNTQELCRMIGLISEAEFCAKGKADSSPSRGGVRVNSTQHDSDELAEKMVNWIILQCTRMPWMPRLP